MSRIGIRPIPISVANAAVDRWHRHHKPVLQHRWSLGAFVDRVLVGVAIVEEPKAEGLRGAVEVTRLATNGSVRNAATRLLSRAARDAISTEWRRIVSYTRIDERGTCYRAAGWRPTAIVVGREWVEGNKRLRWLPGFYESSTEIVDRVRWEFGPDAAPELPALAGLGRRPAP